SPRSGGRMASDPEDDEGPTACWTLPGLASVIPGPRRYGRARGAGALGAARRAVEQRAAQCAASKASLTFAGILPRSLMVKPLARAHSRIAALSPLGVRPPAPRRVRAVRPPTLRAWPTHRANASRSSAAFAADRSIS